MTALAGTSSMPRLFRVLLQAASHSIETGSAVATPSPTPFFRAAFSS